MLGAEPPGQSSDSGHGKAENEGVGLPVGGLGVPTTGRRPDVLGISADGVSHVYLDKPLGGHDVHDIRNLASSAHCEVCEWVDGVGDCSDYPRRGPVRSQVGREDGPVRTSLGRNSLAGANGRAQQKNTRPPNCCHPPLLVFCLLLPLPPRPLDEANTHCKMRLAIAGPAAASPALVSIHRSKDCAERHHTT